MQTKTVKIEIGKILAIIIVIAIIAITAGFILNSDYFKGDIREATKDVERVEEGDPIIMELITAIESGSRDNVQKVVSAYAELDDSVMAAYDRSATELLSIANVNISSVETFDQLIQTDFQGKDNEDEKPNPVDPKL